MRQQILSLKRVVFMKKNSNNLSLILFCFLFFNLATMSPVGCSWKNENTSPAGISTNGQVTLSWSNIQDGSFYNIYVATTPGVTKFNSNKIQNPANPITITDLEIGTTYYFIVTAVNDFGEREISREVSYKVIESEGFIEIEDYLARQDFTIFFDTSSNRLSGQEIKKLNRVAQLILGLSDYKVNLNGYTDSSGEYENNKTISLNRAAVVKSYLVGKGIKPEIIEIKGHGAANFIASNNTAKGRKMNRRVEISFFTIK
jgi:outer membrane protein OmpA-like peptidoglycan-associated protein